MTETALRERIRDNCCPLTALTESELDRHAEAITQIVLRSCTASVYLRHVLLDTIVGVEVYEPPTGRFIRSFPTAQAARSYLRRSQRRSALEETPSTPVPPDPPPAGTDPSGVSSSASEGGDA